MFFFMVFACNYSSVTAELNDEWRQWSSWRDGRAGRGRTARYVARNGRGVRIPNTLGPPARLRDTDARGGPQVGQEVSSYNLCNSVVL